LRAVFSHTIDTKIYTQFDEIVPYYSKSRMVEILIEDFLKKKKFERTLILSKIKTRKTTSTKRSVS